ncbi:MAG: polyhydroxyalkanoic acid system family protein [Planctomycetia bacterium]
MKSLEVRVPHSVGRDEARRRLDAAIVRARDEYADKVGEIEASWEGEDLLRLQLSVLGMPIGSEVDVREEELIVRVEVPGMAGLFAGRIKEGIQKRLGGLLGSQPA